MKRAIRILIMILVFIAVFVINRIITRGEYTGIAGFTQGTTYQITWETGRYDLTKPEIDSLLHDFDLSLSAYIDNSIISRFNLNDSTATADEKFITVFNKAYEVYEATDGAFDITVAPVVNALGFGAAEAIEVDSALIDSLITFVGMQKVRLEGNELIKDDERIKLDVNAIAQGFAVDVVTGYLDDKGIKNYLVEIGGEVRAHGKNPNNERWRIGIDKPVEGNLSPGSDLQAIIRLDHRSLATSGNYRRYYEKNGVKYVHTIDPETGYPVVSNLLSATVVAEDCMTADAYATSFMVMGLEQSVRFLESHDFLQAYLIYGDETGAFQVYVTPGLENLIE